MASETDSSIPPPTAHAPQYYADFGSPVAPRQNQELPPPPPYTVVPIPVTANNSAEVKVTDESANVVNELVNQRFSPTTQRQLNSQQILRVTQYIDKQEKIVNDKFAAALAVSIIGIIIGLVCIGLFVAYHKDLCDNYHTSSTSCARGYSALIIGSTSILVAFLRIIIYCMAKAKISRAKKMWQAKVAQLQQTSVNGY